MKPEEYENLFRIEEGHWWYRALRRLIFYHLDRYLPTWRNEPILDSGCGTGGNLSRLGSHGTVGLDMAPQALSFCRQRGLHHVVRGDVSALPFAEERFAAVISASVLYHQWVPDVPAALRECRRVLRPGGLLLLELPAYRFLTSPHDEAVGTARRFTKGELRRLLQDAGFRICRITYWNTLLFPLVWLARYGGLWRSGRDFDDGRGPSRFVNALLDAVLRVEFALLKWLPLPFGVSLNCVAVRE